MSEQPPNETRAFDALYGLELTECSEEAARARVHVRDELRQPGGLVHGGVYSAIADALAARGTAAHVAREGNLAVALSNHTSVLHPMTHGTMHATAVRRHRGRTTWVWEVEMTDDQGRLCVLTRMTIAVRELPS